jgi:Tfp pilus assembly protein PilO
MTLLRRIFAEKRQFIYPLVGAIIVNAALFAAVVYPLSLRVANGERSAQEAANAKAAAQADYQAVNATIEGKNSADVELKKFYGAVLPPDLSAARRLLFGKVESVSSSSGVSFIDQTSEPSRERGSDLAKLTATVVLVGDYRNIRRFIHDLETSPDFVVLENVALSQGQERDQRLNVVIKVATYYRAEGDGD